MKYYILAAWFGASFFAAFSSDFYLLYLSSICFIAYLLFLIRDVDLSSDQLAALLRGERRSQGHLRAELSLTTFGDRLQQLTEAVRFRLTQLGWEEQFRNASEIRAVASLDSQDGASRTNGFDQLIAAVAERFRASEVFVLFWELNGQISVRTRAGSDLRIKAALANRLNSLGLRSFVGMTFSDNSSALSQFGDLSRFGMRYTLCHPLFSQQSNEIGALLLCYGAGQPPLDSELRLLPRIAKQLEIELAAAKEFDRLSGRVTEFQLSDQRKSEFIAQMSHDFRSPLNNIKSILNLLKLEEAQAPSSEMIDVALTNCDDLAELVEAILDFSRHQAGKLTADPSEHSLVEVVEKTYQSFRVAARLKGLNFELVRPSEDLLVRADLPQLRRILNNLVGNAVKYTQRGSISIRLETKGDQQVAVHVEDSGRGMSDDQIALLFRPFTTFAGEKRADQDESDSTLQGIGLGLALSKILVELNRGEIEVSSKLNHGSCFSVYLPRVLQRVATPPASSGIEAPACIQKNGLQSLHLLLVDDDYDCTATLSKALSCYGVDCISANSTSDALAILAFSEPDAVICDLQMPGGGARRVLKRLKLQEHKPYFIVLSGHCPSGLVSELRELGADQILEKPIELDELIELLSRIIHEARSEKMKMAG